MAILRPAVRALLVMALLLSAPPARSQDEAGDADRLVETLAIGPGSVIAEIGAGDGTLSLALARRVGSDGHVFTTELGAERLKALRTKVGAARLTQVEVVDGHATRTNLADACCDAVVMRDVYHHFGDPAPMNASLLASLKPGGRLAILDFAPSGEEADTVEGRARGGHHGVGRQTVSRELEAAGFVGVSATSIAGRRYLVIGQKPMDTPSS
jgi:SAM-dependent methyltransferase